MAKASGKATVNVQIKQIIARHQEAMFRDLAKVGGNNFRSVMRRMANNVKK
jgi:hypothetical protein